jgi:succinate dehydrogenase / fumarate reductase, cytochrome b subunit
MSWFTNALSGTIGRKILMSITGLFLISFLLVHLAGNFLLLSSDEGAAFLEYAHFMKTNPLIKAMEFVLFGGIILHVVIAIINTIKNKKARPQGYAYNKPSENSSWFSRNMGVSGSIVFIFLVVHLRTFFVPHKLHLLEPRESNVYLETITAFQSELYVGFYVLAMILLGFHLVHGFASAFQTLGLRHPKYTPLIKWVGIAFSVLISGLFALIPIAMYFTHR